jgi:hypothetical protein
MTDILKLRKSFLGALLMVFFALASMTACSSSEEEEACDESLDNAEGCMQDLPI